MSGATDAHRGIKRVIASLGAALKGSEAAAVDAASLLYLQQDSGWRRRAEIERLRCMAAIARAEADREAFLHAEAPSPCHGTTEARLYAVAAEIAREEGADRLSYYADRFVAFAQEIMREPRDMTNTNPKGARE